MHRVRWAQALPEPLWPRLQVVAGLLRSPHGQAGTAAARANSGIGRGVSPGQPRIIAVTVLAKVPPHTWWPAWRRRRSRWAPSPLPLASRSGRIAMQGGHSAHRPAPPAPPPRPSHARRPHTTLAAGSTSGARRRRSEARPGGTRAAAARLCRPAGPSSLAGCTNGTPAPAAAQTGPRVRAGAQPAAVAVSQAVLGAGSTTSQCRSRWPVINLLVPPAAQLARLRLYRCRVSRARPCGWRGAGSRRRGVAGWRSGTSAGLPRRVTQCADA